MELTEEPKQVEPVVAVYPNGQVQIGTGATIGAVLAALDAARQAVLSITLAKPAA